MDISTKILDYLKLKIADGQYPSIRTCPLCNKPTMLIKPSLNFTAYCLKCGNIGNVIDLVRLIEPEKNALSNEEIESYLRNYLGLDYLMKSELDRYLKFYEHLGFDMVRILKNNKIPIEINWTNKEHKNPIEWKEWINDEGNIGVKTGKVSNITVLDIDDKVPSVLEKYLDLTLTQKTNKGYHIFFKYDSELPNSRIIENKIDIQNDGAQVVIAPSVVEQIRRKINFRNIIPFPKEVKEWIKSKVKKTSKVSKKEVNIEDLKNLNIGNVKGFEKGNRNNALLKFGGVLRKELQPNEVNFVLKLINSKFCNPPLPEKEVNNISRSLERYFNYDDFEDKEKVLDYIRLVNEANARDVERALDFGKKKVDKLLSNLVKEGFIIKIGRKYKVLRKVNWKKEFSSESKRINYKIPYFNDIAIFREGDLILLGAGTKIGKSTISIGMIKYFVDQGIIPYYVNLEAGNRFAKIANVIGLKEGDFYYTTEFMPEEIELENNAITIIDWLLPKDYSTSDKLFQHFSEQLVKHKGILIVFMQLRENGEFFAKDMIRFFPALVARYFYDEEDGSRGHWNVDSIREPRLSYVKKYQVPCKYLWEEKLLVPIEGDINEKKERITV